MKGNFKGGVFKYNVRLIIFTTYCERAYSANIVKFIVQLRHFSPGGISVDSGIDSQIFWNGSKHLIAL